MAKTLEELLASRSPESQARIQEIADGLLLANLICPHFNGQLSSQFYVSQFKIHWT